MKRAILMLAALALLLGGVGAARAQQTEYHYTFIYSDVSVGSNDYGTGTLTTVNSGLGDGSQRAISGTFDLQSSSYSNVAAGTYTLLTYKSYNPFPTVLGIGPIDNLIYPPQTNSGPPYLTGDGLLFGPSSLPSAGAEAYLNLYDYYPAADGYGIDNNTASFSLGSGTFTLTFVNPVPEPSGIALLGLGVICLAIGYAVRRRKLAVVAA